MNHIGIKVFVLCAFNIFLNATTNGQSKENEFIRIDDYSLNGRIVSLNVKKEDHHDWITYQELDALMEGDLMVQLKSDRNKIEALQKQLEAGDSKYKEKIQKILNETIFDRDQFNRALMLSMKTWYTYSSVYFFYDSDLKALQSSEYTGKYFLDSSLQKNILRNSSKRNFFVLRNDFKRSESSDHWVLYKNGINILSEPFPSYFSISTTRSVINDLTHPGHGLELNAERLAKKIQGGLNRLRKKKMKDEGKLTLESILRTAN